MIIQQTHLAVPGTGVGIVGNTLPHQELDLGNALLDRALFSLMLTANTFPLRT